MNVPITVVLSQTEGNTITLSCIKISIQLLSLRYYKNAVNQEAGWNQEVIKWFQSGVKRRQLKPADYWGGLVLDEMKIQVYI
jgi:hypothetical protein